jgi:hypothetical protein
MTTKYTSLEYFELVILRNYRHRSSFEKLFFLKENYISKGNLH